MTEGLLVWHTHRGPIQPYRPATFLERGVAVPFTSPLLGGTRARATEKQGLELVVPNLSGGNGIYIVPWKSLASFCRPTLHDKVLTARLAALKSVTPATVRRVAREVAAEGLAGEEAMEAARTATDRDKRDRLLTNHLLLVSLIEQVNLVPGAPSLANGANTGDIRQHAKVTIAWVAPRLGQSITWVTEAMEAFAEIIGGIGAGSAQTAGRSPRIAAMLREVSSEIAEWSQTQRKEDQVAYARIVCSVADFTVALADELLGKARAVTNNMIGLLRTWAAEPSAVIRLAGRPEWLLDGWEQIGLIWNDARDDASRCAALAEIAGFVPILPREVNEWRGPMRDAPREPIVRPVTRISEDWRTGVAPFALIARNERFRAATC